MPDTTQKDKLIDLYKEMGLVEEEDFTTDTDSVIVFGGASDVEFIFNSDGTLNTVI